MSINTVVISGFLGTDPVRKVTTRGTPYCILTVGVNEWTGPKSKIVHWIPVVCWQNLAENVVTNCAKGTHMTVMGSIETFTFGTGGDGPKAKMVRVKARRIEWHEPKEKKTRGTDEEDSGGEAD